MENFASTDSYVQEDFAETADIIKKFRANLNAIPKNERGSNILSEIFTREYTNNFELIKQKIVSSFILENILQEGLYNRIVIKNNITKSTRISNLKIEGSIFHCEFDNIDLSGKYNAQISLTRDKKYNVEYKKIVLDAIPKSSRYIIEPDDPTKDMNIMAINVKGLSSDLNPDNVRQVPKVILIVDYVFKQMNIINDENIPIIFINCSGNVNITMNTDKVVTTLRSIACPPPVDPTTKLVGTAVAAVVVTVVIYSAILHFRK